MDIKSIYKHKLPILYYLLLSFGLSAPLFIFLYLLLGFPSLLFCTFFTLVAFRIVSKEGTEFSKAALLLSIANIIILAVVIY
ncbi:MAG: hypothetical protein ACP5P2_00355 [Candidatus Micrarchaeia archaeon]